MGASSSSPRPVDADRAAPRAPDGARRGRAAALLTVVGLVAFVLAVPFSLAFGAAHATTMAAPNPTSDNVTIDATSSLSFVSNAFSVYPGATVHLTVVQQSSFAHTFTLSSVANTTITSTAFFHTHPPLVNLSLGSTAGKSFFYNFTAPAVGTYEFVCVYHFGSNMIGEMTSTTGTSSGGGGYGGTSAMPIPPLDWAIAGGVAVVVVAGSVVGLALRRHRREEQFLGSNSGKRRNR